jgi:hypothetical protein
MVSLDIILVAEEWHIADRVVAGGYFFSKKLDLPVFFSSFFLSLVQQFLQFQWNSKRRLYPEQMELNV